MKVADYIRQRFQAGLDASECLVVYDPERHYRDVVLPMACERLEVVDASGSGIRAREAALKAWLALGAAGKGERRLLVYVPDRRPAEQHEQERDPFWVFAVGGAVFPDGDADEYLELCLKAKLEHAERVCALFEQDPNPSFETLDALDAGADWPKLRSLLSVQSAREILTALLAPTSRQREALERDGTWQTEYRLFAVHTLGFSPNSRLRAWKSTRDELARFLLFSEFCLDLRGEMPAALASVPHADASRKALVLDVCEGLRSSKKHQDTYVELAEQVSRELDLERHTAELADFGERDTFRFEERAFLRRTAAAILRGDLDEARRLVARRSESVWAQTDDAAPAWVIAERGVQLLEVLVRLRTAPLPQALAGLVEHYVSTAREADTLHRHFEQTVYDAHGLIDGVEEVIPWVRRQYRAHADRLQAAFMAAAQREGWPPVGMPRQAQVFDSHVAPVLELRRRVAFFMVDALRYEMALELAARLPAASRSQVLAVAGHLPSITAVGMAALLPGADTLLRLARDRDSLVPSLGDQRIVTPAERLDYLKAIYGDRCAMLDLNELMRAGKLALPASVHLLVVKTTDIDIAGENLTAAAASLMRDIQRTFLRAVKVLAEQGFAHMVFATDHGFLLLGEELPGDKVEKPAGAWLLEKQRALLGSGGSVPGVALFDTDRAGIRGEVGQIAVPETFGAFRTGSTYLHGGLSLQESVLPVVVVEIKGTARQVEGGFELRLQYRGGATDAITTRRPMIEVSLFSDMYGTEEIEFRLEAKAKNRVVGEAGPSPHVDPSTGLVRVKSGAAVKVPLRMDDEFEGKLTVVAINPATQATYAKLELRTDYVE